MINQERRFSLGIVVDLHPWIVSIACSKHLRDGRGAANEARGTIVYHGKVGRLHKTWKRFPVTILSAIDRCAGLRGYGEDTARATCSPPPQNPSFSTRSFPLAWKERSDDPGHARHSFNPRFRARQCELEHETKAYFEIVGGKRVPFYLISRESIIRALIAKLSHSEDNFCITCCTKQQRDRFKDLNCGYYFRVKLYRFENGKNIFKIDRFWKLSLYAFVKRNEIKYMKN